MNIGNITAKWAALDPSRPAIVDIPTGRRVSFGELDARVRQLANGLCAQGLEKGARIGVLAKNSIEYFEVYYACARAGLIAQPLNWRLGVEELSRILEDGGPSAIVTSDEFRGEGALNYLFNGIRNDLCAVENHHGDLPILQLARYCVQGRGTQILTTELDQLAVLGHADPVDKTDGCGLMELQSVQNLRSAFQFGGALDSTQPGVVAPAQMNRKKQKELKGNHT